MPVKHDMGVIDVHPQNASFQKEGEREDVWEGMCILGKV